MNFNIEIYVNLYQNLLKFSICKQISTDLHFKLHTFLYSVLMIFNSKNLNCIFNTNIVSRIHYIFFFFFNTLTIYVSKDVYI